MSSFAKNASAAEQLVILGALAVGGYMLYTLIQTLKNGPGELADWATNEAESIAASPSIDPNSGVSIFSWLP